MDKFEPIDAIKAIKKLLFGEEAPATPPVPPATPPAPMGTEYPLADGTTALIDKVEIGGVVTINGAPAPDGIISLADGTKITIVAGVITLVETGVPADPAPQEPTQMTQEQVQAALQKFAEGATPDQQGLVIIVKALFENVFGWDIRQAKEKAIRDQAIAVYQQGFNEQKAIVTKQQEALGKILELVEHLGTAGTEAPVEVEKDWNEMSALERFRATKN